MPNIKYKKVKHSINDLERVNNILNNQMNKLEITSMGISQKENKIFVHLKKLNATNKNKILKLVKDPSIIEFEQQSFNVKTSSSEIINGESGYTPYGSFTIGFRAKSKSTGKTGIVIPGHLSNISIGSNISYNGSVIGTIKDIDFQFDVDAAFVETNNNYTPSKNFMNGDYYTSIDSSPLIFVEGMYIMAYGAESGK